MRVVRWSTMWPGGVSEGVAKVTLWWEKRMLLDVVGGVELGEWERERERQRDGELAGRTLEEFGDDVEEKARPLEELIGEVRALFGEVTWWRLVAFEVLFVESSGTDVV